MSAKREELEEALSAYFTQTLTYIQTIKAFSREFLMWELCRQTEVDMMLDIRERVNNLDLSLSHVTRSEDSGKAFRQYMQSKVSSITADSKRAELEAELAKLLEGSLQALQSARPFLEAVEKLAATSLHVFAENRLLRLHRDVELDHIQVMVLAAKYVCPLVLEFRTDAERFFLPRLQNLDVLAYQLDKLIQTSISICQKFENSCFSDFSLENVAVVELDEDLPEKEVQIMLDHINQLVKLREDPNFRLAFLFQQKTGQDFVEEFKERRPRMLTFLEELEETAVQLDRMNTGARISTVAGSSVGAVGGILSIVGLALIPFTAGVSLSLTMAGVGLGITSGVNSLVTTATEIGVNATQQKKASEVLQSFMEDVQILQDCVDEAKCQTVAQMEAGETVVGVGRMALCAGAVGKGIDSMVDLASVAKLMKNEEIVAGAGKVLLQEGKAVRNIPRVASEIPELGQAAAKSSIAISKSARAGLIGLNALFLGVDIFMICKDSISLAKDRKTETSQFIRARAALWSSVMDSWQAIYESLEEGLPTLEKKEALLETPFYPETKEKDPDVEETWSTGRAA